jgi:hypothetical protein
MNRNFFNENFEDHLKQAADGFRMRPSEKTWKGLEKSLTKRRSWTFFIASAFLLTASLLNSLPTDLTKSGSKVKPLSTTDNAEAAVTGPATAKVIPITRNQKAGKSFNQSSVTSVLHQQNDLLNINTAETDKESLPQSISSDNTFTPTIADSDPYLFENAVANKNEEPLFINNNTDLLSIESVINHYKRNIKKHKLEFTLFFTPTISYRKLSENKSYLRSLPSGSFSYASFYDVKNVVTHKPDMGLEAGFAAKYRIARAVKLRSGLQFNFNGYDIKAFNNAPEMATIALNNRSGVDSVSTVARYRNFNSNNGTNWLKNSYFQVSAPIGVEVKLLGNDKRQFGIATTIQPTYILGDKAYLISTDYKNYAQVPWLMRRWNVNTALETFVAYSTGELKWQIGPQIRYQLLSSFDAKYPVKENLFDFGLKVGVSLNNK